MIVAMNPPERHPAYDPICFEFKKEDGSDNSLESNKLSIVKNNETIATLKRFFNGDVSFFDISSVVRTLFSEDIEPISNIGHSVIASHHLAATYNIKTLPLFNGIVSQNYKAYRSVSQVRNPLGIFEGGFLTNFEKLYRYQGYPVFVAFIPLKENMDFAVNGLNETVDILNPCYILTLNDVNIASIYTHGGDELRTNQDVIIYNNEAKILYITNDVTGYKEANLYVKEKCVPESPFYVRWLNLLGGYDHWMFQKKQTRTDIIEDVTFHKKYISFPDSQNNPVNPTSKKITRKIKIGSHNLTKNEYDVISKLAYSPIIEWFDESVEKWKGVNIEKAENTSDSNLKTHDVEFELILPEPRLQF